MKLALLPLTLTFTAFASGQTAAKPAAKTPVHHAATTASANALPPNIPKATGLIKPLYALRYQDIRVGTGPLAPASVLGTSQADSTIQFYTVAYTGWLAKDGKKFDSSFDHPGGDPLTLPIGVHRVIPGWDTGFTGMRVGGKRRLFIPYQLAYGDSGKPPVIPAKSDLIFDIELVSVSDKPPTPKAPPAPPASAAPSGNPANPAPPSPIGTPTKPTSTPDPTKPSTDPATNDPAKATTPDNATKPAPKPGTNPPGK